MSFQKGIVIDMSIWNVFKKDNDISQKVHSLHEKYATQKISRQDYNLGMEKLLLDFYLPEDVRIILKNNNINILSVDKTSMPQCNLTQLTSLAKSSGVAARALLELSNRLKACESQKDTSAENFTCRYKNISVVPVKEWTEIYNSIPEQEYFSPQQDEHFMWRKICTHAISHGVTIPQVANQNGTLIAGQASFE